MLVAALWIREDLSGGSALDSSLGVVVSKWRLDPIDQPLGFDPYMVDPIDQPLGFDSYMVDPIDAYGVQQLNEFRGKKGLCALHASARVLGACEKIVRHTDRQARRWSRC